MTRHCFFALLSTCLVDEKRSLRDRCCRHKVQ